MIEFALSSQFNAAITDHRGVIGTTAILTPKAPGITGTPKGFLQLVPLGHYFTESLITNGPFVASNPELPLILKPLLAVLQSL